MADRLLICTRYYLAHVAAWESYILHDLGHVFLGWICTVQIDPAQHLTTAGWVLDDLDYDMSDV